MHVILSVGCFGIRPFENKHCASRRLQVVFTAQWSASFLGGVHFKTTHGIGRLLPFGQVKPSPSSAFHLADDDCDSGTSGGSLSVATRSRHILRILSALDDQMRLTGR